MAKYNIILPVKLKPSPAKYELSAARLLAEYFKADIEFISRANHKTPDFLIDGVKWELKSPTGAGRRNIERQLQTGLKQSKNIVFDARRSKIHMAKIKIMLYYQFRLAKSVKRIVLIDKANHVIELMRQFMYNVRIEGSAALDYAGSEPSFFILAISHLVFMRNLVYGQLTRVITSDKVRVRYLTFKSSRGGAVAARRAHNPEVVGSNPTPATKLRTLRKQGF